MITVITPCLNIRKDGREEYFHRMMESVHEQTYGDIEHIVIDGGSDDGTLDILERYRERGWIDRLISEKDSGIYQALNRGVKLAHGGYINIMNTDDFFTGPDFFARSVAEMERRGVDFTHADKIIRTRNGGTDTIKKGNERVAFYRMPFRHQAMIVKRDVYDEIGPFDEGCRIASDYKFILKMLLAGKKGFHMPEVRVISLGGGISSDRETCIREVSAVLYECYGERYRLTKDDCRNIYLQKFSLPLMLKILLRIRNGKIRSSLLHGFLHR